MHCFKHPLGILECIPTDKGEIQYTRTPIHLPTHPFILPSPIPVDIYLSLLLSIHPQISPSFYSPTHLSSPSTHSLISPFFPIHPPTHPSILSIHLLTRLTFLPFTYPSNELCLLLFICPPSFHHLGPEACRREGWMRKTITKSGDQGSV